MTTYNFCFYLQNRLIQTSQTGGQWYSDTSPFSIPCLNGQKEIFLKAKNLILISYRTVSLENKIFHRRCLRGINSFVPTIIVRSAVGRGAR
jgi:hypothetical protein